MKSTSHVIPVILSGGAGSRLWPLSRKEKPKQFLPLFGEKSLFQSTLLRLKKLPGVQQSIVVGNAAQKELLFEQMKAIDEEASRIILEPMGRNTAPALAMAAIEALKASEKGEPDAILLLLPSDHLISDVDAFYEACTHAIAAAEKGALVTFGIAVKSPETGYGYIQQGEKIGEGSWKVKAFVEKPNLKTAQEYMEEGSYFWNSGMFVLKASLYLESLKKYAPDILKQCQITYEESKQEGVFLHLSEPLFKQCRSESIDYAVMEKTDKASVVPMNAGWSDVGSWSSIWNESNHDQEGNVALGEVLTMDSKNCYLRSSESKRLLVAVGLEDLIVVDTPEALLILPRTEDQKVKDVVNRLRGEAPDFL